MNNRRKLNLVAGFSCIVITIILFIAKFRNGNGDKDPLGDSQKPKPQIASGSSDQGRRETTTKAVDRKIAIDAKNTKSKVFEELLTQWEAIPFDRDGMPLSDITSLTEESDSKLLCGQEMVLLLDFLRKNVAELAARSLNERLIGKLKSKEGQIYRNSMLEIKDKSNPFVIQWIYAIGTSCPEEELDVFKNTFGESDDFRRSLLVREIAGSKNPEELIKKIIDTLPNKYFQGSHPQEIIEYPLFSDIQANLPDNSNWQNLLDITPLSIGCDSSPINYFRQDVISRLSKMDFLSAANHTIDNGRVTSLAELNSLAVIQENRESATSYLQDLPPGDAFDAIAGKISLSYITTNRERLLTENREKAREFADQIGDSKKRDYVISKITHDWGTEGTRGE